MTNVTVELERFKQAQDIVYHRVLAELGQGRKVSHWMWFVFPQIGGLGNSAKAKEYAIRSRNEALLYLKDPLLGGRLEECCKLLMEVDNKSAREILGYPDDLKLRSSMTLFAHVAPDNSVYQGILDKFYGGESDLLTLAKLKTLNTER